MVFPKQEIILATRMKLASSCVSQHPVVDWTVRFETGKNVFDVRPEKVFDLHIVRWFWRTNLGEATGQELPCFQD